MLNFDATREEIALISKIADRVFREFPDYPDSRMTLDMDLTVANNAVPLDFERLLTFTAYNFAHDIFGIRQHLNRRTGELEGCFLPRCAR